MAESKLHNQLKKLFAEPRGETEVPVGNRKRLDAQSPLEAIEVELSGNFLDAAKRLKASPKIFKRLVVFDQDVWRAVFAMRLIGVSGTVQGYPSGTAYKA